MRRAAAPPQRVLILGTGELARRLLREVEGLSGSSIAVVGLIGEPALRGAGSNGTPILGSLDQLHRIVEETHPHRIVLALEERRGRLPVRQLLQAKVNGIDVEDWTEFYERLTGKLALESLIPSSLLLGGGFHLSRVGLTVGRALSLLVAGPGLLLLSPLLALIAVAIWLDSRGPIFFVQERIGLRGRRFALIKFRTMHPVAEPRSPWVRDNGDRITWVGRWLRRFRLDELPQFINVLKGDMDLLGPRPVPASTFETLAEEIPGYLLRCTVRPGLTGWAQVRFGYANGLEEEMEKMRHDLYYLKHRSLWLDLRILLETFGVVLLGRGAERADVRGQREPGMLPAPQQIPSRKVPSPRGDLAFPSQAVRP